MMVFSLLDSLETLILTKMDAFSGSDMAHIIEHVGASGLLGYKLCVASIIMLLNSFVLPYPVAASVAFLVNTIYFSACLAGLVIIVS